MDDRQQQVYEAAEKVAEAIKQHSPDVPITPARNRRHPTSFLRQDRRSKHRGRHRHQGRRGPRGGRLCPRRRRSRGKNRRRERRGQGGERRRSQRSLAGGRARVSATVNEITKA
jgi:hypothetical protein